HAPVKVMENHVQYFPWHFQHPEYESGHAMAQFFQAVVQCFHRYCVRWMPPDYLRHVPPGQQVEPGQYMALKSLQVQRLQSYGYFLPELALCIPKLSVDSMQTFQRFVLES